MNNVCFFNSEKKWGGGEKWHLKMSALFLEHGYSVILAGNYNSELIKKARSENIPTQEFKISRYSFLNPIKIYKIYKFFKKDNINTPLVFCEYI